MSSNLPVRRPTRPTTTGHTRMTSTARGIENVIKPPSKTGTRAKPPSAGGTSNRLLVPTASSRAKQANVSEKEKVPMKRKREALTEVTERNGTAAKKTALTKGKAPEDEGNAKPTQRVRQPFGLVSGEHGKNGAQPADTQPIASSAVPRPSHSKSSSLSTFTFVPDPKVSGMRVPSVLPQDLEGPRVFKRKSVIEREERAARGKAFEEPSVKGEARSDPAIEEERVAAQLVPTQQDDDDDTGLYDDIDVDDWFNPTECIEYVHDILHYMKETEQSTMPNPNYVVQQPDVRWGHRETLFDWLVTTHHRYGFGQESLFLTFNIIDRFLSLREVNLSKLQLVGTAAFLVATKFEESMAPSVSQLACDDMTPEEIMVAERYLLRELNWDLSYSGPMTWLRRGSKADGYDPKARTFAKFLIEIGFLERRLMSTPPSQLAAAAMWLSRLALDRDDWNYTMSHYTTYKEHELILPANLLLNYIAKPIRFQAVFKKYAGRKMYKVSIMMRTWVVQTWGEGASIDLAADLPHIKAAIQERKVQELLDQEQNEPSFDD